MAPSLQALSILHHLLLLLAASMLVMGAAGSSELAEPPQSGYRFQLIRSASATMSYSNYEYLMEFRIGNSSFTSAVVVDTGSDLIWTNNSQLIDSHISRPCETADCCHELCAYNKVYSDGTVAKGFMVKASLTFGKSDNPTGALDMGAAINLGCSSSPTAPGNNCLLYREGGVVGFGRGKMSLVSQLGLRGFSYCLIDYDNTDHTSELVLGLPPVALPIEGMQKTKLVQIKNQPSRYYVNLTKITMGGEDLEIPKDCFRLVESNGEGGMFIYSGSSHTHLPKEAFGKVKEHVNKLMKDKHGKEPKEDSRNKKEGFTCYPGKKRPTDMPEMVLHFNGLTEGQEAQMVLPVENYMYVDKEGDQDNWQVCLAITESPQNGEFSRIFILGNFQQQNIDMSFDIMGNELSFVKRKCSGNNDAAPVASY